MKRNTKVMATHASEMGGNMLKDLQKSQFNIGKRAVNNRSGKEARRREDKWTHRPFKSSSSHPPQLSRVSFSFLQTIPPIQHPVCNPDPSSVSVMRTWGSEMGMSEWMWENFKVSDVEVGEDWGSGPGEWCYSMEIS